MNDTIRMTKQRRWSESKAHSSWQIFKIMAEFVDGFEALAKIGPCISIFGSARTQPGHDAYELTVDITAKVILSTGGNAGQHQYQYGTCSFQEGSFRQESYIFIPLFKRIQPHL